MNFTLKKLSELTNIEKEELFNSDFWKKNNLSWKYSPGSISYYREYFGQEYTDNSFVVKTKHDILAAALIFMKDDVSFFNLPIDIYTNTEILIKKVGTKIIEYLLSLIKENGTILMYHNSNIFYETYQNQSFITTLTREFNYSIDLSRGIQTIKSNIRKSYKSLVNWSVREIDYKVINQSNFVHTEFNAFKNFHLYISGRSTRSDQSWEIQSEMIKNDEAILINGYLKDKLVSSSFFMLNHDVYYGVGVYDRKLMDDGLGIAHGSMFKAISHFKELGYNSLQIGFWTEGQQIDEKVDNIFKFKRGFANELFIREVVKIQK